MYAENQGYGPNGGRSFSSQDIMKMYSVKERLDSEERISTIQGNPSLKSIIQQTMQEDYARDRKKKSKLKPKKFVKPYMNEKS